MIPQVYFYFNSTLLHFTQLITGLELLHQTGEINLIYSLETKSYPIDLCRVNYNSKTLIFDMADSSNIRESIYEECDFYIKRMLLKEDFHKKGKLIPYGLNYPVLYKNSFMKGLVFNRKFFKYGIRYHPTTSRILNLKNSIVSSNLKKIQAQPVKEFKMIFRTRLWDPGKNSADWKKEEREKMNKDRIEINKLLKHQFGNLFQGGIEKDELSQKECPDLLLRDKEYHKAKYLQQLKSSSVGIITQGLERSIGWKLGEYVAHSLAILTYPIDEFELLGDFKKEINYLVYTNQKELIDKVNQLHDDQDYRTYIQNNNCDYYWKFLEPAAKLQNIFALINSKVSR